MWSLKFVAAFVCIPYLVGYVISWRNLDQINDVLAPLLEALANEPDPSGTKGRRRDANSNVTKDDAASCYATLLPLLTGQTDGKTMGHFQQLSVVLHRNGQHEPCGETPSIAQAFESVIESMHQRGVSCPNFKDKYQVEAFLTRVFHHLVSTCTSQEDTAPDRSRMGLLGYCDMGDAKTPILLDHDKLVRIEHDQTTGLPCHFHNPNGIRIISFPQLADMARAAPVSEQCTDHDTDPTSCAASTIKELHLYAVPAGRMFMHSAAYVGQIIELPHVRGGNPDKPVYLEVLSVSPAVFDLYNFFTRDESTELVDRALTETKESHRIKRSTTGNVGHNINNRRTSESGYDTDGQTSMTIKKRCFDVLGFDEYVESHADGLQILRYNLTTAYIPHLDYLDLDEKLEHNYDSAGKGGNRFATILLYMTDLDEKDGGETVFSEAWPTHQPVEERVEIQTALRELRESDQSGVLEQGSWQENMVAQCRTRLAIRPNSARAVLFYSQFPNGKVDPNSRHGGCPVLSGVKYAANLWVWSSPRAGYAGNPKNPKFKKDANAEEIPAGRVTATFSNLGNDPELAHAKLYFFDGTKDSLWGPLGHGDPTLSIHTYKGHVWKLMVGDETMKSWTIESDVPATQEHTV